MTADVDISNVDSPVPPRRTKRALEQPASPAKKKKRVDEGKENMERKVPSAASIEHDSVSRRSSRKSRTRSPSNPAVSNRTNEKSTRNGGSLSKRKNPNPRKVTDLVKMENNTVSKAYDFLETMKVQKESTPASFLVRNVIKSKYIADRELETSEREYRLDAAKLRRIRFNALRNRNQLPICAIECLSILQWAGDSDTDTYGFIDLKLGFVSNDNIITIEDQGVCRVPLCYSPDRLFSLEAKYKKANLAQTMRLAVTDYDQLMESKEVFLIVKVSRMVTLQTYELIINNRRNRRTVSVKPDDPKNMMFPTELKQIQLYGCRKLVQTTKDDDKMFLFPSTAEILLNDGFRKNINAESDEWMHDYNNLLDLDKRHYNKATDGSNIRITLRTVDQMWDKDSRFPASYEFKKNVETSGIRFFFRRLVNGDSSASLVSVFDNSECLHLALKSVGTSDCTTVRNYCQARWPCFTFSDYPVPGSYKLQPVAGTSAGCRINFHLRFVENKEFFAESNRMSRYEPLKYVSAKRKELALRNMDPDESIGQIIHNAVPGFNIQRNPCRIVHLKKEIFSMPQTENPKKKRGRSGSVTTDDAEKAPEEEERSVSPDGGFSHVSVENLRFLAQWKVRHEQVFLGNTLNKFYQDHRKKLIEEPKTNGVQINPSDSPNENRNEKRRHINSSHKNAGIEEEDEEDDELDKTDEVTEMMQVIDLEDKQPSFILNSEVTPQQVELYNKRLAPAIKLLEDKEEREKEKEKEKDKDKEESARTWYRRAKPKVKKERELVEITRNVRIRTPEEELEEEEDDDQPGPSVSREETPIPGKYTRKAISTRRSERAHNGGTYLDIEGHPIPCSGVVVFPKREFDFYNAIVAANGVRIGQRLGAIGTERKLFVLMSLLDNYHYEIIENKLDNIFLHHAKMVSFTHYVPNNDIFRDVHKKYMEYHQLHRKAKQSNSVIVNGKMNCSS